VEDTLLKVAPLEQLTAAFTQLAAALSQLLTSSKARCCFFYDRQLLPQQINAV